MARSCLPRGAGSGRGGHSTFAEGDLAGAESGLINRERLWALGSDPPALRHTSPSITLGAMMSDSHQVFRDSYRLKLVFCAEGDACNATVPITVLNYIESIRAIADRRYDQLAHANRSWI